EPRQRGRAAGGPPQPQAGRDGRFHGRRREDRAGGRAARGDGAGGPGGRGGARRGMMTQEDRERTAYHEAGHALVGMLSPDADPVRKVSIIPRGMALGVTFSSPDTDRFNYDEAYLKARLRVALGGRVAEEIVYDSITSGAESDIQQLTQ